MMRAWKSLDRGAVGPISGFRWPTPTDDAPGPWVETSGGLEPCVRGVHACRDGDLAHWIAPELWVVDLDGRLEDAPDGVIATRARLVARVEDWDRVVAAMCEDAVARAEASVTDGSRAYVETARMVLGAQMLPNAAFVAALAEAMASDTEESGRLAAFRRERARQSAFLVGALRDRKSR